MIELCLIEFNNLKFSAMMIVVTQTAILSLNCRRAVVAFLNVNSCFDFGMAGKAFCICNFVAKVVAVCTV